MIGKYRYRVNCEFPSSVREFILSQSRNIQEVIKSALVGVQTLLQGLNLIFGVFYNTLTDLWIKSPVKDRIFVGNHNIECSGGIRESRYRNIQTGAFDGVHLYGSSGRKAYTRSVLNILKQAGLVSSDFDHLSCAQTQYQSRQRGFNKNKAWPWDRNVRNVTNTRVNNMRFEVPVQNRFAGFSDNSQENY